MKGRPDVRKIALLSILLLVLLAGAAYAQQERTEIDKTRKDVPPNRLEPFPISEGVSWDVLMRFADEPSQHLGEAHKNFLEKDYTKSEINIRKAAGFVMLEESRANDQTRQELFDASSRLDRLADAVKTGSVTSANDVNAAFAQAEWALADHHEAKAEELWRAKNYLATALDLETASTNLENALKYAGLPADAETESAIKDARGIANQLARQFPLPDERIGASLATLSDKIDEVGGKLQPKK
jgi:hypothetical protein